MRDFFYHAWVSILQWWWRCRKVRQYCVRATITDLKTDKKECKYYLKVAADKAIAESNTMIELGRLYPWAAIECRVVYNKPL